jgi:transposase
MSVLDVGCGPGFASIGLARLVGPGGAVTAVDLQPEMLDIVRRKAEKLGLADRIDLVSCKSDDLVATGPFDFAVAFYMVHETPDQQRFPRQVAAALKPGAAFFIAEPVFHVGNAGMGMEDKLSEMYCLDNGRPGESPVKLVAVMLLQCMERMPDRQAVDAMTYDIRWKFALRMDLDERGFHPTVLVRFRERLLSHEFADIAFKTVLAQLREAGYLAKKSPHRVDSTHIIGLIADMSRLECIMETIRLALEALDSEEEPAKPEEWSGWWDRYVESKPDYKAGKEALRLKMSQAGADAHAILNWTKDMPQKARGYEKLKMLGRVFDENFELIEGAGIEQRRAQPPGAVHNPHNPEAQWSSKNTIKNKDWIGHKVQVAETVEDNPREKGEPTAGIITAIVAQ